MKKSLLFITFLILAFIGKTFGYCQQEVTPAFAMYNIEDANPINHKTEYLYLYFNTELRPSDYIIAKQLKNHYPDTKLDWDSALTRKKPRFVGDSYHYYYNIPLEWIVTYPNNNIPDLSNIEQQLDWLKKQKELIKEIIKTNIPLEKFRWQFKNIMKLSRNGRMIPAILVKANSSVICILKN